MNNVGVAIILTAFAGLSTSIGGIIAFFSKNTNKRFLAFTLGLSAGVMMYVSFMELLTKAIATLGELYGGKTGTTYAILTFFGGIIVAALIDRLIPEQKLGISMEEEISKNSLMRTGLVTALAIGVHNFPEGMATFVSSLQSPAMAIPVVVAIAIHNIPEGIAVAIPVYFATGSKAKGFLYSFFSGLAEPIGAVVGWVILMPYVCDTMIAYVFAAIAGVMVFISIDELLPSAQECSQNHIATYGFMLGMVIMAASLIGFM